MIFNLFDEEEVVGKKNYVVVLLVGGEFEEK